MADQNRLDWKDEDTYWKENFRTRPYASSTVNGYEYYQPGYRYGFDAANRFEGRDWNDIEPELSTSWDAYEHRGTSTWHQVKDAVRDAWDRVTGKRPAGMR